MKKNTTPRRALGRLSAVALMTLGCLGAAQAENHALIMWIGDYQNPAHNLNGIDKDASMARDMAQRMNVPSTNILEVKNQQLTLDGMRNAIRSLTNRIKEGDKVFIYYSGHGHQVNKQGGGGCTEGLVTYDARLYLDDALSADLDRLSNKASQVIMFNDSCFSGGAGTKDLGGSFASAASGALTKAYPGEVKASGSDSGGYTCGQAVNKMARNLEISANKGGAQLFYLAASADNEVAYPSDKGSYATLAWSTCLKDPAADTDGSGMINGRELVDCSRRWMASNFAGRQTITGHKNAELPMSFARSSSSTATSSRVNPERSLRDLAAGSDPSYRVNLRLATNRLRIKQDPLDFTVESNKDGYLYIVQAGSDKKTFNILYPNRFDKNNYVRAGSSVRLPGDAWRIKAGGPVGTSYMLAIVSPTHRNFTKDMDAGAAFGVLEADDGGMKTLYLESAGAAGAAGGSSTSGRYGTSSVVEITEVQ